MTQVWSSKELLFYYCYYYYYFVLLGIWDLNMPDEGSTTESYLQPKQRMFSHPTDTIFNCAVRNTVHSNMKQD
jgi:hypothetical protein